MIFLIHERFNMNIKIIIFQIIAIFHMIFQSHVYNKFKTKTIVNSLNFITVNNVVILSLNNNKEIYIFHAIFLRCNISVWYRYQMTFTFMIAIYQFYNCIKLFEYLAVMIKSCHFSQLKSFSLFPVTVGLIFICVNIDVSNQNMLHIRIFK